MLGLGLGLGRNLLWGGGSDGNLVPGIDFTTWYNVPLSPMASTTTDTFTNSGTGYIQLDIGAVAGEVYTITINQTRGAGTCLIYLAADQGVTQADEVWGLEGGEETITLVADGPWLTFRASIGDTTTTVTELSVVKKKVVTLDQLIQQLYGGGQGGGIITPSITLLGEQNLWQQFDGAMPVSASGDPIGRNDDQSGNDYHAIQSVSSRRPTYQASGEMEWMEADGSDDFLALDVSIFQGSPQGFACVSFAADSLGGIQVITDFLVSELSTRDLLVIYLSGSELLVGGRREDGDSLQTLSAGSISAGTQYVISVWVDWANAELRCRLNGVETSRVFQTAGVTGSDTRSAAIAAKGGGGSNFGGNIYSTIIVDGPTTEDARIAAEEYASDRAGGVM
jgi:hypothetical protein